MSASGADNRRPQVRPWHQGLFSVRCTRLRGQQPNCGTTREGEVDLVHPLKAGFETDPKSTHTTSFGPELKAGVPPSSIPGTSRNSLSRAKFAPPCPEGELAQKNHKIQSNTHPEIPQDEIPPKFSSPPIFIHTHTYPHLVLAVARRRSSIRRWGTPYFSCR